jgi:hypothetical protein
LRILEVRWAIFDPRLTLVWFISLSNVKVSSWKFYHNLLTSPPRYAKNFSSFECSWTEIDFWGGGGGLKKITLEGRQIIFCVRSFLSWDDSAYFLTAFNFLITYAFCASCYSFRRFERIMSFCVLYGRDMEKRKCLQQTLFSLRWLKLFCKNFLD